MTLILSGTDGLSDIDGSASTPAIRGTDANTGIFFPAADTIAFAEGGAEVARFDSSGNFGIGTTSPAKKLDVYTTGTSAVAQYVRNATVNLLFNVPDGTQAQVGTETSHPLLFLTGNAERARITTAGDFQFNSGYGSVATAYGCRAWVNFNGTGVVAIRASGNVSSITDNGNGDYTVNFSNAMPDANYVMHGTGSNSGTVGAPFVYMRWNTTAPTTSASRIGTVNDAGTSIDNLYTLISVFR